MNTAQLQPDQPTDADLELLSAYIDNQLSGAERMGLEQRLRAEPRLRAELAELRATTELLRNLEPVRPPRSFALDPATAPRRARFFPFAWIMQLGGGFAGLALVLLASVQLLTAPAIPPALESAPAPMAAQGGDMSAAAVPAATEAPAEVARESAPASAPEAAMSMAVEDTTTAEALPPDAGGATSIDTQPAAPTDADQALEAASAEPYTATDEAAGKLMPAPRPGLPPTLILAFGLALLAAAAGTFLYERTQR
jgi:anti-sigma factor RsiW